MSMKVKVISAGAKQRNILLIEDDPSYSTQVKDWVEFKNPLYNVIVATTATEGLEMLETEDIHLILLDLGLPDMNGEDFMQKKNEYIKYRLIPLIVVTAKDDPKIIELCETYGSFDYLVKYDEHFNEKILFGIRRALNYYDRGLTIQTQKCLIQSLFCRSRPG